MKISQRDQIAIGCPQSNIKKVKGSLFLTVLALFFLFILSSCAKKPWGGDLQENEEKKYRALVEAQLSQANNCSCCINAELTASWDSHLTDGAIKGYLQIFQPTSIKLVALNPFGQPLFAFSTDSKKFQSINAAKGVFKYGKVSNFVQQYSLPENIFNGAWSHWLTGSMNFTPEELASLHYDQEKRGIWLTIEREKEYNQTAKEHLLYDPLKKLILERVIKDSEGHIVAKILYKKYLNSPTCPLPTSIHLEGIAFSATVHIYLSDFLLDQEYDPNTFYLKLPPGYVQQQYR